MKVAIGKHDETTVLGSGVLAGLFLANQGALVFGLRLEHNQREPPVVEQQEINKPFVHLLEIIPQAFEVRLLQRYTRFQKNIRGRVTVREKAPPRRFEQLIDFDSCGRFFFRHILYFS